MILSYMGNRKYCWHIDSLSDIDTFFVRKMHLKMSSGKWRPFCLGLNVLKSDPSVHCPVLYLQVAFFISEYTVTYSTIQSHMELHQSLKYCQSYIETKYMAAGNWILRLYVLGYANIIVFVFLFPLCNKLHGLKWTSVAHFTNVV